jgi:tetratricopeptide (TPR) repeat protein
MFTVLTRIFFLFIICSSWLSTAIGQPALSFDLKKPQKFENKKLGSEKTEEKKFTVVRRFTQNGVTKFNWHFNANTRLNEIIARVKAQHKDDYTQLLSFYNYSLDKTALEKSELDSVIYKANAGILIHDLRNSWIDNLYMLMGKAYYFRNELDTAYLTFQYINYAFSPKEKDGYDIPIGSNATEGNNAFSISTKENRTLTKKIMSRPPSRNESFIWQIRTYIAKDEMPEAAGLIETLKSDPNFPERLQTDLHEVRALWFYKQQVYDSAAVYLEKALGNAENREERSRWEYLIAQLYERSGKHELASEFYKRTIAHTLDPVLEVYARLNAIRQNKGDEKAIQQNIDALSKMARRDRYTNYRDIIYITAAQIELERNNPEGAKNFLLKAAKYSTVINDNQRKSRAYLMLADLSFQQKEYANAKDYYDSVVTVDPALITQETLDTRKNLLSRIVQQLSVIERQDSLQRLAAMPEAERETVIRKLVKQLRKKQGLKEDERPGESFIKDEGPSDLFGNNKGEWYFNNAGLKSKGNTKFKSTWGDRPNVDNWRRMAAVSRSASQQVNSGIVNATPDALKAPVTALTYEDLLKNVPLTPEQMTKSNDSLEKAQLELGKVYVDGLEDYALAITTLEQFNERYPYSNGRPEALQYLYYCYTKTGNTAKAAAVTAELQQKYAGSPIEKMVSNPTGISADSAAKLDMTKRYNTIYSLFIEGNFEQALQEKKTADSLYSTNYWTPQLLYIQSIYFIRQRQDDSARTALQNIINMYAGSPLAAKSQTLIDVLSRRKEIEEYLTQLQIQRPVEDSLGQVIEETVYKPAPQPMQQGPVIVRNDSTRTQPPVSAEPKPQANQPITQPVVAAKDTLKFQQAPQQPPPAAVTRTDTLRTQPPVPAAPRPVPVKKDSVQTKPAAPPTVYMLQPDAPHFVVLILDKVDPVYITEARNAFNRYNKEKFFNRTIEMINQVVTDDTKLILMTSFENADAAIDYINKVRKPAEREVIPWLPAAKYSFGIITGYNLEVLKNMKDINAYKAFLSQSFPGKF